MATHDLGEEDPSFPLDPEMLRRRKYKEPTAELPEALRALAVPPRPPKQVRRVERPKPTEAAEKVSPASAYCPPWAGVAYAPKRVRLPGPARIMHRGKQLEPRADFQSRVQAPFYDDPNTYPWRCVCRITDAYGRVGSGALCGPRHILTASHCVAWSSTTAEKIELHLAGAVWQAELYTAVALSYTQIESDPASANDLDDDFAVIVCTLRVGDRFGWLGTKEYDSSWDGGRYWSTMGYPATSLFPLSLQQQWLDEDDWDLGSGRAMRTSSVVARGQSGSPMFGSWPDGLATVAVMSSGDNWCAGGSDLVRLVNFARSEHP